VTATYSTALTSAKDQVRLLIGDTDMTDALLQDEEIVWLLDQNGSNVNATAVQACELLAAKFARLADTQVDDVRVALSQRARGYHQQAASLRARMAVTGAGLFAGGISVSAKDAEEEDTDRVPPIFTRDMHVVSYDPSPGSGN
jgi:hypothetical protein